MRKVIILTLLVLCQWSWAGVRPEAKMRKIAASKLLGNAAAASKLEILDENSAYRIYGKDQQGFVIVSTDENAKEVLGYSTKAYDKDNLPPAFKLWLKAIEVSTIDKTVNASYTVVPNFMTSTWGQGDPYNFLCPQIDGQLPPCGCVATAMGQIMYYYQHPVQGTGSGYYTVGENTTTRYPDDIKGIYQWGMMKPKYSETSTTDDERIAVSTLLKDAGLAVHMNYNIGGSGAQIISAAQAFINNFGYDSNTTQLLERMFYSEEEWYSVIYNELAAKRPILVGGMNEAGKDGHAFIFSGIDEDGKVYVNWGWNGSADGYYEIKGLNPRGILGSNNMMDFNFYNEIICGLRPAQGEPDISLRHSSFACNEPFTAEYQKIRNWLKVKTTSIYNNSLYSFSGEIKLYCQNMDGDATKDKTYTFLDFTSEELLPGYGYFSEQTKTVKTTDLDPGKYYIYLVSQAINESTPQMVHRPGGIQRYIMTKEDDGKLTVEEDTPTGIFSIYQTPTVSSARIFDLQGREVKTPQRGIYIINGKKVVK